MSAIFFALISFLGWGTGDIFGAITARKIGGYSLVFWSHLLAVLMLAPLIPFKIDELQNITLGIGILSIAIVLIAAVGDISFSEGLRKGNVFLVGVIAASYPALAVILSTVFLGERINILQIISILIIFLGIFLSTLNLKGFTRDIITFNTAIPLAILAMICWGTYLTFIKILVNKLGWFWPGYFIMLSFPLIFLFMRWRRIKLNRPGIRYALLPLVVATILIRIAEFSYNTALSQRGDIVIISPISGSYPVLFVVLAFLIFKDRITRRQIAGIITTLIGIVLLSVFSV